MPNSPHATKQHGEAAKPRPKAPQQDSTHADPIHRNVAGLQRASGNQAVSQAIRSGSVPAGIPLGPFRDRHEQEAGRVAREVLDARAKRSIGASAPTGAISGGLSAAERAFFEPRFGVDLSAVRVHTDRAAADAAEAVGANAFTVGHDIVFGRGRYTPGSESGRRLLAHELTHVVQQSGAGNLAGISGKTGSPVVQREPANAEEHQRDESVLQKVAARAMRKADDPFAVSLAAIELAYRLIHARMPKYDTLLSGVTYAAATPGVKVVVERENASVTVGKKFIMSGNDPNFETRASNLQAGLDRAAAVIAQVKQKQKAAAAAVAGPDAVAPSAAPPDAASAAAATTAEQPLSDLRQKVLVELNKWAGANEEKGPTEGKSEAGKKFDAFISPASIASARKNAAQTLDDQGNQIMVKNAVGVMAPKTTAVYTTCVDFEIRVLGAAGNYPNVVFKDPTRAPEPYHPAKGMFGMDQAEQVGAWHAGKENMTERPKKGDIYYLYDQNNHDQFSHMGYIQDVKDKDGGKQVWSTVDGGAGLGAHLDLHGKQKPGEEEGHDKIARRDREYDPVKNLLEGEHNQGRYYGWVRGWIDIDKLPRNPMERSKMEAEETKRKASAKKAAAEKASAEKK